MTKSLDPIASLANMRHEFGEHGGVLGLDFDDPELASKLITDLQNEERFGYIAVSLGYTGEVEQRWEPMERSLDRCGL